MTYIAPKEIVEATNLSRTKDLSASQLEQKQPASLKNVRSLPVDIEAELDFGTYFYTVRYGAATLGMYRKIDSLWKATPIYGEAGDTFHTTSTAARKAIISSYTKQPVNIPEVIQVYYHITLDTEEVDEDGICWERREIVELDGDARIDWDLWLIRYSQQQGEGFSAMEIFQFNDNTLEEF